MHSVVLTLIVLIGLIILMRGYIRLYNSEHCKSDDKDCMRLQRSGLLMTLLGMAMVGIPFYMVCNKTQY